MVARESRSRQFSLQVGHQAPGAAPVCRDQLGLAEGARRSRSGRIVTPGSLYECTWHEARDHADPSSSAFTSGARKWEARGFEITYRSLRSFGDANTTCGPHPCSQRRNDPFLRRPRGARRPSLALMQHPCIPARDPRRAIPGGSRICPRRPGCSDRDRIELRCFTVPLKRPGRWRT